MNARNRILKPQVKQIYRIENLETMRGMWYDKNGNYKPFTLDYTHQNY